MAQVARSALISRQTHLDDISQSEDLRHVAICVNIGVQAAQCSSRYRLLLPIPAAPITGYRYRYRLPPPILPFIESLAFKMQTRPRPIARHRAHGTNVADQILGSDAPAPAAHTQGTKPSAVQSSTSHPSVRNTKRRVFCRQECMQAGNICRIVTRTPRIHHFTSFTRKR